jgi:hypothetical protein
MTKKIYQRVLQYLFAASFVGNCATYCNADAQNVVPELQTKLPQVSIQDGIRLKRHGWTMSTDADPDIYVTQVPVGTSKIVKFFSNEGQLVFQVEGGKTYPFTIIYAGKSYHTQIMGKSGPDTYDLKF